MINMGVGKASTVDAVGTIGLATNEGRIWELWRAGPCQAPSLACSTMTENATTDTQMSPSSIRLSNPVDIDPLMDVLNGEVVNDNVICVQSSSNSEVLSIILTKKQKLRSKLLRVEHHRLFLRKSHVAKVIPKGLRLNRRVNPISGIGTRETVAKIEDILRKAEEDILSTLISHNENLVDDTRRQLEEIERQIQSRPNNEKGIMEFTLHKAEENEDVLRSSLKKTR